MSSRSELETPRDAKRPRLLGDVVDGAHNVLEMIVGLVVPFLSVQDLAVLAQTSRSMARVAGSSYQSRLRTPLPPSFYVPEDETESSDKKEKTEVTTSAVTQEVVVEESSTTQQTPSHLLEYQSVLSFLSMTEDENREASTEPLWWSEYDFPGDKVPRKDARITCATRTTQDTVVIVVVAKPQSANETDGAVEPGDENQQSSDNGKPWGIDESDNDFYAFHYEEGEYLLDIWVIVYQVHQKEPLLVHKLVENVDHSHAHYERGKQGFGYTCISANGQNLAVLTDVPEHDTDEGDDTNLNCTLSLYSMEKQHQEVSETQDAGKNNPPRYKIQKGQDLFLVWGGLEYGQVNCSFSTCGRLLSIRWSISQYEAVQWRIHDVRSHCDVFPDGEEVSPEGSFRCANHIYFTVDNDITVEFSDENEAIETYVETYLKFLSSVPRFCRRVIVSHGQE